MSNFNESIQTLRRAFLSLNILLTQEQDVIIEEVLTAILDREYSKGKLDAAADIIDALREKQFLK